jgi:alkanesulfonate monooxygenase SsuD/methylene tetrahydromethanopterin reductase-like flavin-dependent oxidoreductase (luciferase family)
MLLYHFSECAWPDLPGKDDFESFRVALPSGHYDPATGGDLYNQRLDEWCRADELGINIMLNEHHQTPTCVVPSIAVIAGALARQTKKVRILQLGNPVGNRRDPIRVAEETAMVDVISGGRLDCGFVRGVPFEIAPANSNPTSQQERLWESVDLVIKAWTSHDGPFRWEGKHFHYRSVNVWPRPLQQPHPPLWMPTSSTTTARELARRKWVCATMATGYDGAKRIFDAYRETYRATHGAEPAPDRFAFLGFCHVAENETAARAGTEELLWYLRNDKVAPQYGAPPGYLSPEAYVSMQTSAFLAGELRSPDIGVQEGVGNLYWGTPDRVVALIEEFHRRVGGIGHLMLMGQAGPTPYAKTAAHLKLLAEEVYPRLKELRAPAAAAAE